MSRPAIDFIGTSLIIPSAGTGATAIVAAETVCNGIDDDGNGVVDDVDLGKDGVCGCLRIATIGESSPWGNATTFLDWNRQRGTSKTGSLPSLTPLSKALLDEYQALVLLYSNHAPITRTAVEAEILADWVREGGGLLATTGHTGSPSDVASTNAPLAPFGIAYSLEEDILHGNEAQTTVCATSLSGNHIRRRKVSPSWMRTMAARCMISAMVRQ